MSRLRMSGSKTGLREKSSLSSRPEVQIRCRETLFTVAADECDVDCKVSSRRGSVDTMLVCGRTRERWIVGSHGRRPAFNPSSADLSVPEGREGSKRRRHPCRRGVFEPRQDDKYEGGQGDSSRPMFSNARGPLSRAGLGGLRVHFPGGSKPSSGYREGRETGCVARGEDRRGSRTRQREEEVALLTGVRRRPALTLCVYAMFCGPQQLDKAGSSFVS